MKERIKDIVDQCTTINDSTTIPVDKDFDYEKFAELIIKECVTTLEFHGYDEAVPYIKWMATNKLGVKE